MIDLETTGIAGGRLGVDRAFWRQTTERPVGVDFWDGKNRVWVLA